MLVDLFGHSIDEPLPDAEFNRAALRIFAFQYSRNAPYAAFCYRRDRTPETVAHWSEVPVLPTAAFKEVTLVAGDAAAAEIVFRTSGTTQGAEKRGRHHVLDLSIYHFALIPNFAACVLPDGAELRMLSLIPPSAELPDSSLSHMASVVLDRLGSRESGFFATASHGIDDERLHQALSSAQDDDAPVCILGTSFAFVHWLDRVAARGDVYRLPRGSRIMDTGGYKGRSREVDAVTMRGLYQDLLGILPEYCVNEYGMTELCSQFYDSTLRDAVRDRSGERRKLVPPWVRTRVVDPETLKPLQPGDHGLLQHFDLANVGSVMAVQTEDLGLLVDGGFHLMGRAPGAQPRGCSLAMDLLLEAVEGQRR
ncbi:coenzyme F390 synthetase [soil metagenome]